MIVITLVRSRELSSSQDVLFQLFLFQLEGCVSVLMASVSAFRSLFASTGSRAARKTPKFIYSARNMLQTRRNRLLDSDSDIRRNGLPSIPSATMTGLRTFIGGGPKPVGLASEFDGIPDIYPLAVKKPETIHTRDTSVGDEV